MIEKMKVVQVVTTEAQKKALLDGLRDLGVIHFAEKKSADKACLERFNSLSSTAMALATLPARAPPMPSQTSATTRPSPSSCMAYAS